MTDDQPESPRLTHVDEQGNARMVDVGAKDETARAATARAFVAMAGETVAIVRERRAAKGDVLTVAQVAGIMAVKRTADLIPMCHPIPITGVDLTFDVRDDGVAISATVRTVGRTGVEMEALTAVSVAALTVYDMLKGVDRGMTITGIELVEKAGGRSGTWRRST